MAAPVLVAEDRIRIALDALMTEGRPITGWGLRRHAGAGSAERLLSVATRMQAASARDEVQTVPDKTVLPAMLATYQAEAELRITTEVKDLFGRAWGLASDLSSSRVAGEVEAARARTAAVEADLADATVVVDEGDQQLAASVAQLATAEAAVVSAEHKCRAAERGLQASEIRLQEVRASLVEADTRAISAATALADMVERAVVAEGLAQRAADKINALCEAQARSNRLLTALDARLDAETAARARAEAKAARAKTDRAAVTVARPKRGERVRPRLARGGLDAVSSPSTGSRSSSQGSCDGADLLAQTHFPAAGSESCSLAT